MLYKCFVFAGIYPHLSKKSQKAVFAYFTSKQILPFDFAEQSCVHATLLLSKHAYFLTTHFFTLYIHAIRTKFEIVMFFVINYVFNAFGVKLGCGHFSN